MNRWSTGVALAMVAAGCSSTTSGIETDRRLQVRQEAGIVLMTQNVVPAETMDALFEGRVVADQEGCLRLDSPDAHTVIWPHGFAASVTLDEVRVLDGGGEVVGTVGGTFSLAGGEVVELTDALGFTAEDRALAATRCPGRYWIVG